MPTKTITPKKNSSVKNLTSGENVQKVEFRVESKVLKVNESGGLVEDPPLLELTQQFMGKLIAARKSKIHDATIVGVEGAYLIIVEFDTRQMNALDGGDEAKAIVKTLAEQTQLLTANSQELAPKNASELGLGKSAFGLAEATAAIAAKHRVTIKSKHGPEFDLPAPPVDAINAVPKPPVPSRRVDGEITAIGRGDDKGVRVEVNKAAMLYVSGLSLEEAINHMKSASHVSGEQVIDDGKPSLMNTNFYGPEREQDLL